MTELKIIDADAHVIETDETWDYLEPSEAKYRPTLTNIGPDTPREGWTIDGVLAPALLRRFKDDEIEKLSEIAGRDMRTPQAAREMKDINLRLKHMDQLGINTQVLFPTMWLQPLTSDPDGEAALSKSYNTWLRDIYKSSKERLRWACIPPTLLIDESLNQIRQAKQDGAVAVFMRAFEGNRVMTDPYFYPIYGEAEKLNMPIAVHIGNGNRANCDLFQQSPITIGAKGFAVTRVPAVVGCMWLLLSDIPKKFPKLRWGFIESAAQWIPWVHNEVVRRLESTGEEIPDDLFGTSNIYATCQNDDELTWILRYSGPNSLIIGTDYGHTDPSAEIDAISIFRNRQDIDQDNKNKILSDNPRSLYNI